MKLSFSHNLQIRVVDLRGDKKDFKLVTEDINDALSDIQKSGAEIDDIDIETDMNSLPVFALIKYFYVS